MKSETGGSAPWIEVVEKVNDGSTLVTVKTRDGRRVGYYLPRFPFDGYTNGNGHGNGHGNGNGKPRPITE